MMIARNAPSTVVIRDTETSSSSKFPLMSSRTGQSGLLFAAEVQTKAAENANEQKNASNKAVIWKVNGNVNLLGARERIGRSTLMMLLMMMMMVMMMVMMMTRIMLMSMLRPITNYLLPATCCLR